MGQFIGIDLGTINSVAAVMGAQGPRVLDNKEDKPITRSVVSLKQRKGKDTSGAEILVGESAFNNGLLSPEHTIISIKRLMGRGVNDPEVEKVKRQYNYEIVAPTDGTKDGICVKMGGKEFSPQDISAMILRKIKDDAEMRLGEDQKVTHAVITVPAYFSQVQRRATREAAAKAGLNVIRILEEPTAAAVAFGVESVKSSEVRTIVVYDLGGGTFDVSVLMCAGSVFAPLDLEGDMWLGGDNFDQLLVDHALSQIRTEYGLDPSADRKFMAHLRYKAQDVKEQCKRRSIMPSSA